MWCHTMRLPKVPPDPHELALILAHLDGMMPWGKAKTWHLAVERVYVGGNDATSITCAETAGMIVQELGRMRTFATVVRPYASQWRSILWPGAARLRRGLAKVAAVDFVERHYGKHVDDNAAEAVCIAAWRMKELLLAESRLSLDVDAPAVARRRPRRRHDPRKGGRGPK